MYMLKRNEAIPSYPFLPTQPFLVFLSAYENQEMLIKEGYLIPPLFPRCMRANKSRDFPTASRHTDAVTGEKNNPLDFFNILFDV